nr:Uronate isomerase [Klebsiella pneumoniae]
MSPSTADEIWDQCNDLLAQDAFSARGIMKQMNVKMVGTTDDPIDSLEHHAAVAKDNSFDIKVLPSWRPDKAFNIELATFNDYMAKLGEVSDTDIRRFADLQSALTKRLDHFAAHGCKVSDHALDVVLFAEATDAELDDILARRRLARPLANTKWRSSKPRCWYSSAQSMPVAAGSSSTTLARCVTTTSVSSNC